MRYLSNTHYHVPPRFGANEPVAPKKLVLEQLKKKVQAGRDLAERRVVQPMTEKKTLRQRFRQFNEYLDSLGGFSRPFWAFVITLPAGILGGSLFMGNIATSDQIRNEAPLQRLNQTVGGQWRNMTEWARQSQAADVTQQVQLRRQMQLYVDQFIAILSESKNPADKDLANKLRFEQTLHQATRIKLAADMLSALAEKPASMTDLAVIERFVNGQSALGSLPRVEKELLAHQLYQAYQQQGDVGNERLMRIADVFTGYINQVPDGITRADLAQVQTEADAIQVLDKMVDQSTNFRHLSQEDKDYFKKVGRDILDVLDYPFAQHSWYEKNPVIMVMSFLAFIIGITTGSLGVFIVIPALLKDLFKKSNRQKMKATIQSWVRLQPDPKALKVIYRKADKKAVTQLQEAILSQGKTLDSLRQSASMASPAVRELFAMLYQKDETPGWEALPEVGNSLHLFANQVHQQFVKAGKNKVTQREFYQAILDAMNRARETHNFLPEFDTEALTTPLQEVAEGNLSEIENRHAIDKLHTNMTRAYLRYINYTIAKTQKEQELQKNQESELAKQQVELAKELTQKAKELMETYEKQQVAHQLHLMEQLRYADQEAAQRAIRRLELERQQVEANPVLKKLEEGTHLQKLLNESRQEKVTATLSPTSKPQTLSATGELPTC